MFEQLKRIPLTLWLVVAILLLLGIFYFNWF